MPGSSQDVQGHHILMDEESRWEQVLQPMALAQAGGYR